MPQRLGSASSREFSRVFFSSSLPMASMPQAAERQAAKVAEEAKVRFLSFQKASCVGLGTGDL